MNEHPLVSVIIPYYNQGVFLQDALNSLRTQTYQNIEIIIINDGSDDEESVRIFNSLNSSDSSCVLISQLNTGPSVARNNAVKLAKGEYLLFLDADDIIHKDAIALCCTSMEKDDAIGVVYGNYRLFGEKNEIRYQRYFDITKMLRANEIALCSMVRKRVFLDAGGFDAYLSKKGIEDWDFWLTLYEKQWKFCYLDKIMFDVRVHSDSRTFSVANKQIDESVDYVYKKHAVLLSKVFLDLYHENKNLKRTDDYRIGHSILWPFRLAKNILRVFRSGRNTD